MLSHRYWALFLSRNTEPYNYIYIYIYKLAAVVEGDQNAPFSIVTTPMCREARNSFPWIAPFYPRSLPYSAEC